ncbi:MAG: hypothetical protein KOO60_03265 [Gemmatimonadales bacterium]|nr:hypothetical protein [Gemmatimonadales bacterium]
MIRKREQGTHILLGKGRPLSRGALLVGVRVALSKSPALDWAKGQLVIMIFSALLLVLGIAGVYHLVFPDFGERLENPGTGTEEVGLETGGDSPSATQVGRNERLRKDLFKVPVAQKKVERKEPRTNPVELLRQVELQGVLGGSNPKAIVQYRRTKETVTVSAGDDLGEFKVIEIRERSVILKWRDELFELSL